MQTILGAKGLIVSLLQAFKSLSGILLVGLSFVLSVSSWWFSCWTVCGLFGHLCLGLHSQVWKWWYPTNVSTLQRLWCSCLSWHKQISGGENTSTILCAPTSITESYNSVEFYTSKPVFDKAETQKQHHSLKASVCVLLQPLCCTATLCVRGVWIKSKQKLLKLRIIEPFKLKRPLSPAINPALSSPPCPFFHSFNFIWETTAKCWETSHIFSISWNIQDPVLWLCLLDIKTSLLKAL